MKPRIAIGITTYRDISSPDIGGAVFDAYAATSDRIVPDQIKVWDIKSAIERREDFVCRWLTEMPYEVREGRSKTASVVETGAFQVGAEWRRTSALTGRGEARFRPALDTNRTNEILISHSFSPHVDWLALFRALVAVTAPAYAMLHLFTDREVGAPPTGDRFERFDGPFGGEKWFTHFRSPLGHWDGPDDLRLKERRTYRFLPELSWANLLGPEFSGNYDPRVLAERAAITEHRGDATLFTVTPSISDVRDQYDDFNLARVRTRAAFPPRSFHRSNMAVVGE